MSVNNPAISSVNFRSALAEQEDSLQDFSMINSHTIEKRALPISNLAANAINLAYGINRQSFALKDSIINGGLLADTHWEVLTDSRNSELTNQYGFKAVAFINRHTHEIHIASAGTVADRYDVLDDLLITVGRAPNKLQPLKALVDEVVQAVGGTIAAGKYRFSTSGHSLGAVVADITGLEIASRGLELVSSTTFENPGSEMAIRAVLDNHWLSGDINSDHLTQLRQRYTVYNAKPNCINTLQPQFADHCNLVLSPKPEDDRPMELAQIGSNDGLYGLGQYLYSTVGSAISTCASYLGLNHLLQTKQDHGLQNFQDLEQATVIPVKQWLNGWNWRDPLVAKAGQQELFEALPTQSPSGDNIFFEDEHLSYVNIQRATFDNVRKASYDLKKVPERSQVTKMPQTHPLSEFQVGNACSSAAFKGQMSAFGNHAHDLAGMEFSGSTSWNSTYQHPTLIACV